MNRPNKQRFPLGQIVATPAALEALARAGEKPQTFVTRHSVGDWGDLDPEDVEANEQALLNDERILSAYILATGEKLWVITEADRSVSTLLLPSDY